MLFKVIKQLEEMGSIAVEFLTMGGGLESVSLARIFRPEASHLNEWLSIGWLKQRGEVMSSLKYEDCHGDFFFLSQNATSAEITEAVLNIRHWYKIQ